MVDNAFAVDALIHSYDHSDVNPRPDVTIRRSRVGFSIKAMRAAGVAPTTA